MKKLFLWLVVLAFMLATYGFSATILSEKFDGNSSLSGWSRNNTSYVTYYTGSFKIGTAAMRIRKNYYAYRTVNTTGYSSIHFKFKLAAYSLESGEKMIAEYSTDGGSTWTQAGYRTDGQDNGSYASFDVALPSSAANNPNLKIRFRMSASSTYDYGYVDEVYITGTAGGGSTTTTSGGSGNRVTIFEDNFNSSSLGSSWSTGGTGDYRVRVSSSYSPYSSPYHVLLDDSTKGGFSTAYIVLNKDLSNYKNIKVEFYYKEYGDENHDSDGLYVYNGSWHKVKSFNNGPSSWTKFSVDLSSYSGITKIKWQQYDNYPMTSDGICIDNVKITGEPKSGGGGGPSPSSHGGMGAIVYSGGVAFRVWAPNASAVAVAGDFNGWSSTANPLASEGNGYWSVDVPGAYAGQQYKFVITYNGSKLWRIDPYAKQVTSSVGNSVIVNPSYSWSSFYTPSWNELVIYELHVKTFAGSFGGMASKMSYLKDTLCVNAVELMPVAEFPGDYSWGYNPAHLFAPESSYGGYSYYKQMVNQFHQNGIAVIQDIVHNHYGPSDLSLWNFDGPSFGNGGIYFYTDWRKTTPWGDTRPDYGRGEVRSFIKDNALYWLTEMNCDGLRWDSTICIRKAPDWTGSDLPEAWSMLQWINNEINSHKGQAISIAEDLQNSDWMTKTTGEGGAGFDSQWCAEFVHNVREQAKKAYDSWRDMNVIKSIIEKKDNGDQTRLVKYSESHDECANGHQRLTEEIDDANPFSYWAKKRAGLAGLTAIFSIGIPMLFQGQEFLEDGYFSDGDPLDWSKASTYAGYVQMYRDAIRLKRNWYNNTRGLKGNNINVFHVNNNDKVIAFHRWYYGGAGDDVIVIMNWSNNQFSSYNLGAPHGGTWYCRYNSDWNGYDSSFGNYGGYDTYAYYGSKDGLSYNMNVSIGKYAVLVYSQ